MSDTPEPALAPVDQYSDSGYFLRIALVEAVAILDRLPVGVGADDAVTEDETRVAYHTRIAGLMAIFFLEAETHAFLERHFGRAAVTATQPLNLRQKMALAQALIAGGELPPSVHKALGDLIDWRNGYAHGRRPILPRSLPGRWPPMPSREAAPLGRDVREAAHLVRQFLLVERHLDELETDRMARWSEDQYADFSGLVSALEEFAFDDAGRLVARAGDAGG